MPISGSISVKGGGLRGANGSASIMASPVVRAGADFLAGQVVPVCNGQGLAGH